MCSLLRDLLERAQPEAGTLVGQQASLRLRLLCQAVPHQQRREACRQRSVDVIDPTTSARSSVHQKFSLLAAENIVLPGVLIGGSQWPVGPAANPSAPFGAAEEEEERDEVRVSLFET